MTIALLLHPYGEKEMSGLGRAALSLARALVEEHPEHHFDIYVREGGVPDFRGTNWTFHAADGGRFWLDRALWCSHADAHVFFTPVVPFFVRPRCRIVIAHDFAYLTLQGGRAPFLTRTALRALHRFSMRGAAAVVAVSEHTKNEIVRLFRIDPRKIAVVYDGVPDVCAAAEEFVPGVESPFFLCAGGVKKRKNIAMVVRAFAQCVEEGFSGQLVIAGKNSGAYADDVRQLSRECGINEHVVWTGFVSDGQLSYLYHHALVLVFVSRLEGFGMTALEAMRCGTPTIVSDEGALREAVGDGALRADPDDADAIVRAMMSLWRDENLRRDVAQRGGVRAAQFTWTRAARELLAVIEHNR